MEGSLQHSMHVPQERSASGWRTDACSGASGAGVSSWAGKFVIQNSQAAFSNPEK